MSIVRGADIVVQGDFGAHPFILDRDLLDANPGSELTPWTGAWDDVTCLVLSIGWTWGAGNPFGPLTESEGGRAQVSLHDTTRAYDPSNATSPYYNFLRVGMPLRVLVDGAAGWTGTLEAWEWDVGDQVATLSAIDAIATLAALVVPDDTLIPAGTTASQAAAVLTAAGWPASGSYTGTSTASRTDVTVSGQAMEALHAIRFAELGAVFGTRAGVIAWWARGVTASSTPTAIINCGGVGLVALASVFNRGRVRNVVRIDDSLNPYVAILDASATRHGQRTVRASGDDLAYPVSGRVTAFAAWAQTILDALGNPRPASRLGTLVPVGAAQVDAILRAEWGDVWRIVDTGSSPRIDRTVRVLGQSVTITPSSIEVDAVTEDLTGDAAGPTAPGAPVLVSATAGNAQVTLTWTAPASDGGSAITGYTVTASPGGATCTTTGLTCIVTGLSNGTSYSFTVKATNAIGTGPASNALSATPTAPVPNYAATVLATSGLVAYWRMGEASGYPQDSKGTNHATVLGGTPTYGAAGATGDGNKAIGFNGSAWFVVPDAAALDVGDAPWTIELWMKRASFGANFVPWSKGNQGELIWDPSNKLYLGNGSTANTWTTQAITDTNWHHYVFARASNVTGQTKVYIDGVDDTGSNTGSAYAANATPLTFGGRGTLLRDVLARDDVTPLTPTLGYNGAMDEIALYNRALSASEVLAHYNAAPLP